MSEKVFRDVRTQIGVLTSRGLIIRNKTAAKKIILKCNYYNLINGYKEPFLQTGSTYEKYLTGTRFEEIYALYEFDRKLRAITLEYILEIEKQIKALTAYCFSKAHSHKNYLRLDNFDTYDTKKYEQVCNLLSSLFHKISLNINKDPSMQHYVSEKNHIPLWVFVNTISMGDISKFYSNMKQADRNEVAKRFKWGLKEKQLTNCLFFLATIRNRCAHDERLYSFKPNTHLCGNKYFDYFHITTYNNNYFAVMVALKLTLPANRYSEYHQQVDELLQELSTKLTIIPINKIRKIMGFPGNWRKLKSMR